MLGRKNLPLKIKTEISALLKLNDLTKINGLMQNNPPKTPLKQRNTALYCNTPTIKQNITI